jgi:hypothetical protein
LRSILFGEGMFRENHDDLPYFDEIGNDYIREIRRQDAYTGRGGKLSAPQQIKYENRVAMLVERLVLILDAVQSDPEAIRDYLESIEVNGRNGLLPSTVYSRFKDHVRAKGQPEILASERERDRLRFISGEVRSENNNLSALSVDQLLEKHERGHISMETLFQQFRKREKSGTRLQKMDQKLWNRYRSWVAEKRRIRRAPDTRS